MLRCFKKLDLNVCGLLVTTTLFLFPAIIFLLVAFECVPGSNENFDTVSGDKTNNDGSCRLIDRETTVILLVFGFLFLFMGIMVCAFAFLVHHTNAEERRKELINEVHNS